MVGLNIRTSRKALGWTQRDLSTRLDVDTMLVSNWERGVNQPSRGNLVALADVLGRDLAWFFTEREPNGDETPIAAMSVEQGHRHTPHETTGGVNPAGGPAEPSAACPRCNGTGTFTDCNRSRWRCSFCGGTGQVKGMKAW
jgi:transcriptional regulator with XRE-family HTH domain